MKAALPRILLAKVGLDGHDRALRMLALELRERGAEVIMLGVGSTPDRIAAAAIQEDVAAVGISILSGAHLALVPEVVRELRAGGAEIPIVCGGTIPAADVPALREAGVSAVASVGTTVVEAVDVLLAVAAG